MLIGQNEIKAKVAKELKRRMTNNYDQTRLDAFLLLYSDKLSESILSTIERFVAGRLGE